MKIQTFSWAIPLAMLLSLTNLPAWEVILMIFVSAVWGEIGRIFLEETK